MTFDTAAGLQRLRSSGFTEEQASAIVDVLREAQSELVTKDDLRYELALIGLATAAQHVKT